jgi:tRNA G26 N,N-dimethylase Trm1
MDAGSRTLYWHCRRCRLAIRQWGSGPPPDECPRCRQYSGVYSPLFSSQLNARELRAEQAEASGQLEPKAADFRKT